MKEGHPIDMFEFNVLAWACKQCGRIRLTSEISLANCIAKGKAYTMYMLPLRTLHFVSLNWFTDYDLGKNDKYWDRRLYLTRSNRSQSWFSCWSVLLWHFVLLYIWDICGFWSNWWPSLFKVSFHKNYQASKIFLGKGTILVH